MVEAVWVFRSGTSTLRFLRSHLRSLKGGHGVPILIWVQGHQKYWGSVSWSLPVKTSARQTAFYVLFPGWSCPRWGCLGKAQGWGQKTPWAYSSLTSSSLWH